jgi:hypothetical protein
MTILQEVQATPLQKKGLLSEGEYRKTAGRPGSGIPNVIGR